MKPATDSCCVDDVKAVEANRPFQVAGADQISLVTLVWQYRWQLGVRCTFGLILASTSMSQAVPAENTVDSTKRRQWLNAKVFKLPKTRLSTAKQVLIVEIEANYFDDLFNLFRCTVGDLQRLC